MSVASLIDVRALRYNRVTGTGEAYDRLHAARQAFLDKFENGRATATDVLQFILLEDDCGHETIPTSEGAEWLRHNADRFADTVGNVDAFVETVLGLFHQNVTGDEEYVRGAWLAGYEFLRTLVSEPELMLLLSPEWRERMVREVWPEVGSNGNAWIAAAVQTGVSRKVIATAILERLGRVVVTDGVSNCVSDFLLFGRENYTNTNPLASTLGALGETTFSYWDSESVNRREAIRLLPETGWTCVERIVTARLNAIDLGNSVPVRSYNVHMRFQEYEKPSEEQMWRACFRGISSWSVLTADELHRALLICEAKAPGCLVNMREHMAWRLNERTVEELVGFSMSRIDTVSGIPDSEIARLTLDERRALATRIATVERNARHMVKPTSQFLFKILTDLPRSERRSFYENTIVRVLKDAHSPAVYSAWRQLNLVEADLDYKLRGWLEEDGYKVGTIHRVPFGSGWQLAVDVGRMRYVQQRSGHRYHPTAGDQVMFSRSGNRLTSSVVAVNFVPVMKDAD